VATDKHVNQASNEVHELINRIDSLVDDYLKKDSKMETNQRIVNVGRALNAYHVAWISNLENQTNQANDSILFSPIKNDKPFIKPSRGTL